VVKLPKLTVKEWLAVVAMGASIIGAAVLTFHRIWLIRIIERAKLFEEIADLAKLDTVIIGAIILALGFAINRRTIKLSKDGLEASGGAD
jgi:uncharacterized membrane-anchored protein